jgi:hypothetical protein
LPFSKKLDFTSRKYSVLLRALNEQLARLGYGAYQRTDSRDTLLWRQVLSDTIVVEAIANVFPVLPPFEWQYQFSLVGLSTYVAGVLRTIDLTRRCTSVASDFAYRPEENVFAFHPGWIRWALDTSAQDSMFKGTDSDVGKALDDFSQCYAHYAQPVVDSIRTPAGLAHFLASAEEHRPLRGPPKRSIYNIVTPIRTTLVLVEAGMIEQAAAHLQAWKDECLRDADQSVLGARRLPNRMCEIEGVAAFIDARR